MRVLAAVLGALALAVAAGAAPRADPVPGAEHLDSYGGRYVVPSNGSDEWTLRGTSAKPKVVEWLRKPNPKSTDPFDRQGIAVLWAPTCSQGRQKVHLRRSFFLAGPEYTLGAVLEPVVRGRGSFEPVELRLNGITILKTKGSTENFDPTSKGQRHMRFGRNNLEVIAVKAPNDKGVKCNVSKATGLGLAFYVNGDFGSDTGLLEPEAGDSKIPAAGLTVANLQISFEVRNNGPGGAAGMGLVVQLGIPHIGSTVVVKPEPTGDIKSCNVGSYVNDPFQPVISCRLVNMKRGERAVLPVRIAFQLPEHPFGYVEMSMAWQVMQGGKEVGNLKNNKRIAHIYFCDSNATTDKCK